MEIDVEYATHRLIKQYCGRRGCLGEHPEYAPALWQDEVERCHTGLGYWNWVVLQIASEPDDDCNSLESELKLGLPPLNLLKSQFSQMEDDILRKAGCEPSELRDAGKFRSYPFERWIEEALSDQTRLGYLPWLAEQIIKDSCGDNGEAKVQGDKEGGKKR
jgi:hypothetical protein